MGGLKKYLFGRTKVKIYADADVNAFIAATLIRQLYQTDALNYLITTLKSNSLWTRIHIGYPIVGGNSFAHAFNMKNPLNTDAANRLAYIGVSAGNVHNNNGFIPHILGGSASCANTFFIPSSVMNVNSQAYTVCIYQNYLSQNAYDMGCELSTTQRIFMSTTGNTVPQFLCRINSGNILASTSPGSNGIFTGQRISSTQGNLFYNKVNTRAPITTTGTLPSIALYLGGYNLNGVISNTSNKVYSGFFVHEAFSNTDAILFQTILETYQSMLGRKSW